MTDRWEPERYKDDYRSALLKLIEEKVESGGRTPRLAKAKAAPETKVIDLAEVLRQSLSQRARGKQGAKGTSKAKRSKAA